MLMTHIHFPSMYNIIQRYPIKRDKSKKNITNKLKKRKHSGIPNAKQN